MSWNGSEHKILLRNEGLGANGVPRFVDVAMAFGADEKKDGRGMALLDFDHDGDLDIVMNHSPGDAGKPELGRATLYRNDVADAHSFAVVDLQGVKSNRDGVGAQITVEAGGVSMLRLVTAGSGYASEHGKRQYFGLGATEGIALLRVRWPGGSTQEFHDLPARRLLRVVEGRDTVDVEPLVPSPRQETIAHP